jgi:lysophospholipase L1-like esterase
MRPSRLAGIFVALAGLLLLGAVSEAALRLFSVFGEDPDFGEQSNAKMRASKHKDLVFEMNVRDPLVNAEGLRDYEYEIPKPSNTIRILIVGDSITYGHSLPQASSFPKQLEELLRKDSDGVRYEVMNFGVGGYNTLQELALYKLKGAKFEPDLVLIGYALNDVLTPRQVVQRLGKAKRGGAAPGAAPVAKTALPSAGPDANPNPRPATGPPSAPRARQPRGAPASDRPLYRHSKLISLLIDRLNTTRMPGALRPARFFVALYRQPQSWSIVADGFAGFGAIAQESKLPFAVVIFPYLDDLEPYAYRAIHAKVAREARANGLDVIDLLESFTGHDVERLRLSRRDVHPSHRGHALAAQRIRTYVLEVGEKLALLRD